MARAEATSIAEAGWGAAPARRMTNALARSKKTRRSIFFGKKVVTFERKWLFDSKLETKTKIANRQSQHMILENSMRLLFFVVSEDKLLQSHICSNGTFTAHFFRCTSFLLRPALHVRNDIDNTVTKQNIQSAFKTPPKKKDDFRKLTRTNRRPYFQCLFFLQC